MQTRRPQVNTKPLPFAVRVWPQAAVWALAIALLPAMVHAEKADRTRPLNFAADTARVDEHQQRNILSGNVEITKGTMSLRAERVEVRQGKDGSQNASASGGVGGLSYFRQKRDGVDEYIEGEAERIDYDSATEVVRFSGRATMRRLRGASVADEVFGQSITYNSTADAYQVSGGPASAAASGRVRGTLAPRAMVTDGMGGEPASGAGPAR